MDNSSTLTKVCQGKVAAIGLLIALVGAVGSASPARADERGHHHPQWRGHEQQSYQYRRHYYQRRRYAPQPEIYYAPPPVVYAPLPPPGGFNFIFPFHIH